MNCLGKLSRDSGHMRVPDPPHMITGVILVMQSSYSPAPTTIDSRAPPLCNNGDAKAMPRSDPSCDSLRANPRSAHNARVAAAKIAGAPQPTALTQP